MKFFDCRATSLCTAKILFKALSFSELFRSCFAVFTQRFRKFGVGISQRSICLNTSVKRCDDVVDASRRDSEYLGYAGGIDIVYVEQFSRHVACVDNLSLSGFRHDGFFRHIKFLGNEVKHNGGKFSNFRHSVE